MLAQIGDVLCGKSQAGCYSAWALLCAHPCWAWALAFHVFEIMLLILRWHWYLRSFLHLDFFILLFVIYWNWSILTLSWLDLISSWCSNILYCHMRPASEYLPNRSWASHDGLDLNEQNKNRNYKNVILNVSVSHNLFVSNRMPFGDCLKTCDASHTLPHITFAHTE